ncbi:unnamed protein product [Lactuca saligna]|uniref:SWIM-type domain-containing protein n=1 Tax=Lactuca saligna TaxID=75948 RepID=A0AA36DYR5_LACSI|nr:unnamed protein product [Lactuca saligna]
MDSEFDAPRWDISAHSPIIEQVISKFKFKLKSGGFFRLARNSCRQVYCFGSTKCLYIDTFSYNLNHLGEEVKKHYSSQTDIVLSIVFVDKYAKEQWFIELDNDKSFMVMLNMYNEDKEVTIYATTEKLRYNPEPLSCQDKVIDEFDDENETNSVCPTQESYHSLHSSDNEYELLNYGETSAYTCCGDKNYKWRIHASLTQDAVTFEVKKCVETHSCIRSKKSGNKHATQGWIVDVVTDKLKSEGDVSPTDLKKWLMHTYNVEVPYMRVFRGREQAYIDMYGKWDESYVNIYDFKQELEKRNPRNGVEIDLQTVGEKKHFLRFFISLTACSKGFLAGCRPYIGLDACHLKGKFNGVLAAATSIDGNNGDIRYKPVLDLLDAIREKLMERFDKKRSKNLGEYQVCRSSDNKAEVKYKGYHWDVVLNEKICSCRKWQVTGLPCVHAAAFIGFTREPSWDKYVDTYFTVDKFKEAYALEIGPMPEKDQWVNIELVDKIYPPIIKRPKKNRIIAHDEPKKRHRCPRCGIYGHHQRTCKNPTSQGFDEASFSKRKEHKKS